MENPIHDMSNKRSVYSKICGSPIYDTSIEGSMDLDAWENFSMEEKHSEFSHDHSDSYCVEPHKVSSNEYIEKQCCENLDVMWSVEYQSQPSPSHVEFPYDLEQLGAYTMSHHSVSLDDQYDDIVSLPHHVDWYISPIQSWIEAACMSTYQFGKNVCDIIHAYDFPSSSPIPGHHAGLHFLNKVSLLWLVTKDKENLFYINKILRWLHWIYDYT